MQHPDETEPFREGSLACAEGKSLDENPYAEWTFESIYWRLGYFKEQAYLTEIEETAW